MGVVNFRPLYKLHHWSLSLLGFVFSVGTMFVIDWVYALLAAGIFAAVSITVGVRSYPNIHWGEAGQALMYHQVPDSSITEQTDRQKDRQADRQTDRYADIR